jgi:hypothetical protein
VKVQLRISMALMEFLKLALTVANLQVRHRFTADQDGSAVQAEHFKSSSEGAAYVSPARKRREDE